MKILFIDTSDDKSFIALVDNDAIDFRPLPDNSRQSLSLFPTLLRLLSDNNVRPHELSCIAVGNGPGAFTGTRIGVMTAKTMSYATRRPVITFCSLKKYVPEKQGPFTVVGDAKSRGFYTIEGYKTEHQTTFKGQATTKPDADAFENNYCITGAPAITFAEQREPSISHLIPYIQNKLSESTRSSNRAEVQYLSTP